MSNWFTTQRAAQQQAQSLGLTHPPIPVLRMGSNLSDRARIELMLDGGVARTEDGVFILVASGGMRRAGLPSYWYLHQYPEDRRQPRVYLWRCEAFRADDAVAQCNLWLSQREDV